MWWNTLLLALRSIRRNLMRSFLTILGIVIGVSAVITMVTLGHGATLSVQSQISSLGSTGASTGVLLWPAVVLHLIISPLLARSYAKRL